MAAPIATRPSAGLMLLKANRSSAPSSLGLPKALLMSRPVQNSRFSTTPERQVRTPKRDNNRLRGLSSIYRSGWKRRSVVDGVPLPKPANYKPAEYVEVPADHGLWQFFFNEKGQLPGPKELSAHGRSWTMEELQNKSWDDLHKLWWACVKERNRIETANRERRRWDLEPGQDEAEKRDTQVWITMKRIKRTLTQRYYMWEDARELAREDPEVDLNDVEQPYKPTE